MPLNGKFLDKSGLTYFWSKLKILFSGKVDKETGKGLSTNDYTTAEKTKLAGIETGANNTVVDSVMSSSSTNPVQNRIINTALAGKQDNLTFDSTPTASSTNPVTSGGIYTDQQRQEAEIGLVANAGAKNLLNITERSRVHQGVTFTVNNDESVSISGGTTGSNSFIRLTGSQSSTAYSDQIPLPKGKYKISCPGASSSDNFRFAVGYRNASSASRSTVTAQQSNNFETEFEITTDTGRFDATVLSVSSSQSYSATVYPLIRRVEIEDNTFVPYAPTNRELYSNIFGSGTPINSGVDLDTLKTAGRYYIETVTDSASLTNNPCMNELFYMNVEHVNGIIIQTIWSMAIDSATMYRRICKDNTWRPWFKFEGTEVST